MAANIARSGREVLGWNRTPAKETSKRAEEAGVRVVASAMDAVRDAEIVILCLSDVADLHEMLFGKQGIASALKPDSIVVDMSTTGPEAARDACARLAERGVKFLDAPVSGGDIGARNGTLTIMVGGDGDAFERAKPVFDTMGKNIRHCGAAGAGQAVKLCNQILCAVNMVAVCEAFELADEIGIDRNLIVEVCGTGAAGSWALSNLGPRIVRGELGPGFMIWHMLKDLRLVGDTIGGGALKLPGTALAQDLFQNVERSFPDGGKLGTHAMVLAYKRSDRSRLVGSEAGSPKSNTQSDK